MMLMILIFLMSMVLLLFNGVVDDVDNLDLFDDDVVGDINNLDLFNDDGVTVI